MSAMNAAPRSSRVVMNRIEESARASITWRFSSPGNPNTNATPSFSRQTTSSCATVRSALGVMPASLPVPAVAAGHRIEQGPTRSALEELPRELRVPDVLAQVLERVQKAPRGRHRLVGLGAAAPRCANDALGIDRVGGGEERAARG